jgi:hypothetical protein
VDGRQVLRSGRESTLDRLKSILGAESETGVVEVLAILKRKNCKKLVNIDIESDRRRAKTSFVWRSSFGTELMSHCACIIEYDEKHDNRISIAV